MKRNKIRDTAAFCLGILLIAALIQAGGRIKGNDLLFPHVSGILSAFVRLICSEKTWVMIGTTFRHLILSLAVSAVIGTALGVAEGRSSFLRAMLKPVMVLLRSLPMIILVVIVMVIRPEEHYRHVPVAAASLILIPIISEATGEGFRSIEPELIDVYRMNSGFNLRVLFRVYLPLMTGYLEQAFVNAAGMGLKLAVSTEYLVQIRDSLGKAVYSSFNQIEYGDIYAYALIMILLVLAVTGIPGILLRLISLVKAGMKAKTAAGPGRAGPEK